MDVQNMVKQEGDKWYVYDKDGKKKLSKGYATEDEAMGRMREIEHFKEKKPKNQFVNIVFNAEPKLVRNDRLADKDYLVVPMIMLTEGVHIGSEGPYYYPKAENAKRVELWNMKPVVVYHPDGPTACTQEVLNTRQIGVIMNAKAERKGERVKAEAWLDEARVKKVDNRILEAIRNEEMLELSTGLFADSDEEPGEWNEEEYNGTLHNYGPDHLAILPDQVGACSVEDGAGFYRNVAETERMILVDNAVDVTDEYIRIRQKNPDQFSPKTFRTIWISEKDKIKAVAGKLKDPPEGQENSIVVQSYLFAKKDWDESDAKDWVEKHKSKKNVEDIQNELSVNDLNVQLQKLVAVKGEYRWVENIFPDGNYFIYTVDGGGLYKQEYKQDGDKLTLDGAPESVIRRVVYDPVKNRGLANENNQNQKEMLEMEKKKIIDGLIANKRFEEKDRDVLMGMPDDMLGRLEKSYQAAAVALDTKTQVDLVLPIQSGHSVEVKNMEEYMNTLPAELRLSLQRSLARDKAEKDQLIAVIIKHPKNTFTKEYLETKDIEELTNLANLAVTQNQEPQNVIRLNRFNYSGQSDPIQNDSCDGVPVLEPPAYQNKKAAVA